MTLFVKSLIKYKLLSEKRKNVHAQLSFSKYMILNDEYNIDLIKECLDNGELEEIYYDPYKNSTFIIKNTGNKIIYEDLVFGINNKIYRFKDS